MFRVSGNPTQSPKTTVIFKAGGFILINVDQKNPLTLLASPGLHAVILFVHEMKFDWKLSLGTVFKARVE